VPATIQACPPRPRVRAALLRLAWLACCLVWASRVHAAEEPGLPRQGAAERPTERPRSIIDLQPFRQTETVSIRNPDGALGSATLIDLNPAVGGWYVLTISPAVGASHSYHIENPNPLTNRWRLSLDASQSRLTLQSDSQRCTIWSSANDVLELARASGLPFAPLCDGLLYVRNAVPGTYTHIERVTQFLRDHVWGGDRIVGFVRDEAFRDAYAEHGIDQPATPRPVESHDRPADAQVQPEAALSSVIPEHLEIDLGAPAPDLMLGFWYPVNRLPGVFVSVMRAGAVPTAILNGERGSVNALDSVESQGLDYLVAFDTAQFELHFALGTDHPRLDWSPRVPSDQRDPSLPGPDGIDTASPLARTGMVSPALTARVVAAFAGGFKREHGAFHYGALAEENSGSHYGFMEQGVLFSKLQPGLSTVYRTVDGALDMRTWSGTDDAMLDRLVDARQNGVPLIEYDQRRGMSVPGSLVSQWGAGNWSGSSDSQLRTVRAGLCLQQTPAKAYLIFGYFSTATPSAMARVFQAYDCRYAMQLDINALEHTYLALYVHTQLKLEVQHLVQGMGEVDRKGGEQLAPRFLGFPDDRDFFYLLRRPQP
jgi:hypothetical protein